MKKVYLIQLKSYIVINNHEYQVADGGEVPEIYSNKKKAETRFEELLKENGKTWKDVNLYPFTYFEYKTPWDARRVIALLETEVN